jgi:dienelactone hydrolase
LNGNLRDVNIVTRDLSYRDIDTSLTGLFCWNEAQEGPRPGILLIHGGAGLDAHAREQACRYAGADWQLIMYGRAQHGFTHQHAVPGAVPGVAYDRLADERSFAAVRAFLAEALAP